MSLMSMENDTESMFIVKLLLTCKTRGAVSRFTGEEF